MQGSVEHLNPKGLHQNPAFTQMVVANGPVKTLYIGMQNPIDGPTRSVVGKGDIKAQSEKTLANIDLCLQAAGAGREHIVMWTIYILEGQNLQAGFEAFQTWWGNKPNPPANSVVSVSTLWIPDVLIGIEAIAVVPLKNDPA
jgi:enamine deaminase RidA (YjgF/YER057c/UK114 family)